jgi:hypothetical protein
MTSDAPTRPHLVPDRALAAVVAFVHDGAEVLRWPLRVRAPIDLEAVDRIARLQLQAQRLGGRLALREVTPALRDLLALVGLLGQVGGQPEGREQRGVDEVVMAHDPVAVDLEDLDGPRRVPTFGVDLVGPERRRPVGGGGEQP